MASMSSLSDLISRWRDLREQGRSVSAEDLGGDCPELLSHPTRCLEAVAFMEDFLGLARDSASLFLPLNRAPATCLAHTPNPPTRRPEPVSSWGRFATCLGDEGRLQTCPTKGASSDARPGPEGYEILGELGRGAMGIVYKARQVGLNRLVALKMIRGLAQPDARQRARFRREAESVARLRHLNVVQVYE